MILGMQSKAEVLTDDMRVRFEVTFRLAAASIIDLRNLRGSVINGGFR